jgi:hypothetical protein
VRFDPLTPPTRGVTASLRLPSSGEPFQLGDRASPAFANGCRTRGETARAAGTEAERRGAEATVGGVPICIHARTIGGVFSAPGFRRNNFGYSAALRAGIARGDGIATLGSRPHIRSLAAKAKPWVFHQGAACHLVELLRDGSPPTLHVVGCSHPPTR